MNIAAKSKYFRNTNWRNNGAISSVNRDDLDDKENEMFLRIEDNPNISTKELSEVLNISFRSVQSYISNLREKGAKGLHDL